MQAACAVQRGCGPWSEPRAVAPAQIISRSGKKKTPPARGRGRFPSGGLKLGGYASAEKCKRGKRENAGEQECHRAGFRSLYDEFLHLASKAKWTYVRDNLKIGRIEVGVAAEAGG